MQVKKFGNKSINIPLIKNNKDEKTKFYYY